MRIATSMALVACTTQLIVGQQRTAERIRADSTITAPNITALSTEAMAKAYGPLFAQIDFTAGRFSPDGKLLALTVSLDNRDGVWLYEFTSHKLIPVVETRHPLTTISDTAWGEHDTLYVQGKGPDPQLYWAATTLHVEEKAIPPRTVLQNFERQQLSPDLRQENGQYIVWVDHRRGGFFSLRVSRKGTKDERLVEDGSSELANYLFDAQRSIVLYPFGDGGEEGMVFEDLRALRVRHVLLPNSHRLRLLDQTHDAHRIAYVVSGTCEENNSISDSPRSVCFLAR